MQWVHWLAGLFYAGKYMAKLIFGMLVDGSTLKLGEYETQPL